MCAGFYCPGRAEDDVYGGSKPIIVSDGGATSTVEVVQQSMTLDMDIHDFEARKDEIRASLAAQYGVPIEQITLEAPTAGSVQILLTITASSDGSMSATDLQAAMSTVDGAAARPRLLLTAHWTLAIRLKMTDQRTTHMTTLNGLLEGNRPTYEQLSIERGLIVGPCDPDRVEVTALYDLKYVLCDGVVYLMIDIEHPREKRLSQLISCTLYSCNV